MKTLIALLFVGVLSAQTPPMIPMATGGGPVGGATNLTTVGSVPYVSASGTLDQDAGQFFWDATNNRLGIGTATPASTLDVSGNSRFIQSGATSGLTLYKADSTGARTESFKLDFSGNNSIGTLVQYAGIASAITTNTSGSQAGTLIFKTATGGALTEKMSIDTSGNVGIGTTIPGYALDVAKSSGSGTARFYDQTATTGSTAVSINRGAAQTGASTVLALDGVVFFGGDNNGGAGAALLGANSPATTLAAPYTWIKIRTADNSIAYIPVWK